MTATVTITDPDTGRGYTFPSDACYEEALDWFDTTPQDDLLAWWGRYSADRAGGAIGEIWADESSSTLVSDWRNVIMATWATKSAGARGIRVGQKIYYHAVDPTLGKPLRQATITEINPNSALSSGGDWVVLKACDGQTVEMDVGNVFLLNDC